MKYSVALLAALLLAMLAALHSAGAPSPQLQPAPPATHYILFNRAPGQGMYQATPESLGRKQFDEVLARFPNRAGARLQTGVSYIFSPFRTPPETTVAALKTFLETAQQTDTPVLVQLDLEHWWSARPDLWNWWDPAEPGFNPANRENVEWTGWSPDDAVKIAWRNWGQQIRVLPPPNFASPRYTAACREEIQRLVPERTVSPLVGTPAAGRMIRMGADGTPSQRIDLVAEECILAYLQEKPLCRTLISEEAGRVDIGGDSGTIFLDPIDGTYNAVTGIPFFAVSLAYAEKGAVQEAFVQNLATGETFTARNGKGAEPDGTPIAVSETAALDESAFSVYGRKFDPGKVLNLGQKIRRWRLLGASALELCYTVCGRIDGFIAKAGIILPQAEIQPFQRMEIEI